LFADEASGEAEADAGAGGNDGLKPPEAELDRLDPEFEPDPPVSDAAAGASDVAVDSGGPLDDELGGDPGNPPGEPASGAEEPVEGGAPEPPAGEPFAPPRWEPGYDSGFGSIESVTAPLEPPDKGRRKPW